MCGVHTQYGENYAFITNPATTAPKEQCERTKIGHFAILLDRCLLMLDLIPHGIINPLQGETTSEKDPMRVPMRKDLAARIPKSMDLWQHDFFMLNIQDE